MACCSNQCERRHKCANHMNNPRGTNGIESVENYYWFGSGSISSEGCTENWWCGPHGNWGMFTPVNVELLKKKRDALDKTIKELECGIFD